MELDGKRLVEQLEREVGFICGPLVLLLEIVQAVRHCQSSVIELGACEEGPAGPVEDGVLREKGQYPLASLPFLLTCNRS